MKYLFSLLFLFTVITGNAQIGKFAPNPPMGWNSWNYFGKAAINEKITREVIDAMVESGMRDAGYNYVIVDGGWRDTVLGPNGELLVNREKFPSGMKALAEYAHSRGLKFGLHTVPGTHDCGCDPVGGWSKEKIQFQQFLDWGVDFIKLDRCRFSLDENPTYPRNDRRWFAGWDKEDKNIEKAYTIWNKLILESGKPIVLSASAYRFYDWYPRLTNMGRTTGDIKSLQSKSAVFDNPENNSVMTVIGKNDEWADKATGGYWNDPDMLVTGKQGLTDDEQRAHFALWCVASSPLLLGNDPRNMSTEEKKLILNKTAIAINQDPTEQGRRIKVDGKKEVWVKKLRDGKIAILLLNRDSVNESQVSVDGAELGLKGKMKIENVFEQDNPKLSGSTISHVIRPHSAVLFLIKSE